MEKKLYLSGLEEVWKYEPIEYDSKLNEFKGGYSNPISRLTFHRHVNFSSGSVNSLIKISDLEKKWNIGAIKCGENACVKKVSDIPPTVSRQELVNVEVEEELKDQNPALVDDSIKNEYFASLEAFKKELGPKQIKHSVKNCKQITTSKSQSTGDCYFYYEPPVTRKGTPKAYYKKSTNKSDCRSKSQENNCMVSDELFEKFRAFIEEIGEENMDLFNDPNIYRILNNYIKLVEKKTELVEGISLLTLYLVIEKVLYESFESLTESKKINLNKKNMDKINSDLQKLHLEFNNRYIDLISSWESEVDSIYCKLETLGYKIPLGERHPANTVINKNNVVNYILQIFKHKKFTYTDLDLLSPKKIKLELRLHNKHLLNIIDFGDAVKISPKDVKCHLRQFNNRKTAYKTKRKTNRKMTQKVRTNKKTRVLNRTYLKTKFGKMQEKGTKKSRQTRYILQDNSPDN